jgi:hypothetical protein
MKEPHAVIGIILWVLVMIQPILGFVHHRHFKKHQARGFQSYAHILLGRFVITLGIVNGGLGFFLANYSGGGAIAYGLLAGIVWVLYMLTLIVKRKGGKPTPPKRSMALVAGSQAPRQDYYGEK